jgi:hypothetical protein
VAKLRLAKMSLERRMLSEGDEEAIEAAEAITPRELTREEVAVKEEIRLLGAVVSVMASLLGELELEQYLR